MLLRKHIGSARIISVKQPGLERILEFELEHLDELGDLVQKAPDRRDHGKTQQYYFLQGRRNHHRQHQTRFCQHEFCKRGSAWPGIFYSPDHCKGKSSGSDRRRFQKLYFHLCLTSVQKALYDHLTGISPIIAEELCHLASIDSDRSATELTEPELIHLYHTFRLMMEDVKEGHFSPSVIYDGDTPIEYASVPLSCYDSKGYCRKAYDSISALLENYYASRDTITRIRQKSSDLRRIVQTALERSCKKYDLQLKQLKDTEKREKYRIYGELLNTYGYELKGGEKSFKCINYYDNKEITIPLDPQLTARENAQKHFDKYNKLKRTYEALSQLTKETKAEVDHLESVSSALDIALEENDLVQIKEELMEFGYVKKRRANEKRPKITSKPFHYVSSDGYDIFVGKNNYQNEDLTFKVASGNDWWFHAKGIPGSHVIVKSNGQTDLPDRVFEEAGALAAYYSKGRENDKVEIDYIQKKNIKKVAGAAPGFVIYHTNYSLVASPKCDLQEVK